MNRFALKTLPLFLCTALCAAIASAEGQKPGVLADMEEAEGFRVLHDAPPDELTDFVLRFRYRISPGGRAGVVLRAEHPESRTGVRDLEIRLLDNTAPAARDLAPYEYNGSLFGIVAAKRNPRDHDFLNPPDQWNDMEISVSGNRIRVVSNGETVVDADLFEFRDKAPLDGNERPGLFRPSGRIAFLRYNGAPAFRDIRVKELNVLPEREKEDGFQLLFDGKKLSRDIWQGAIYGHPVENGAIVCRARDKHLMTKEEFENFIFRCEYKLTPGANNGIAFRCPSAEGVGAWEGLESQILDHLHHPRPERLAVYQYNGSIYGVIPAKRYPEKNDYLKPLGDWNFTEISVIDSHVKVVLNGGTLVDADLDDYKDKPVLSPTRPKGLDRKSGVVGFQAHIDPVEFRNIRIKKLK